MLLLEGIYRKELITVLKRQCVYLQPRSQPGKCTKIYTNEVYIQEKVQQIAKGLQHESKLHKTTI